MFTEISAFSPQNEELSIKREETSPKVYERSFILLKMKGKFRLNLKKVWGIIGMERYKKLMGKVLEQNGRKRHCGDIPQSL